MIMHQQLQSTIIKVNFNHPGSLLVDIIDTHLRNSSSNLMAAADPNQSHPAPTEEDDFGVSSLANQLRVFKLRDFHFDKQRLSLITMKALASFTQLEVLVLDNSLIPDLCLVGMHHLRCLRLERVSHAQYPLGAIRIARYLSVLHSLRSFYLGYNTSPLESIIAILCDSDWSDTLALVKADTIESRHRTFYGWSNRPESSWQYVDPIPSDPTTLVALSECRQARFDKFESRHIFSHAEFHRVCFMPFKRMNCHLGREYNVELNNVEFLPSSLSGLPDRTKGTLRQLECLELCVNSETTQLHGMMELTQLRSLHLKFSGDSEQKLNVLPHFVSLTLLQDLTLESARFPITTIDEQLFISLQKLTSLRHLDLKLNIDRPFPFKPLAESLASLPHFLRLDLRLHCFGKGTFAIPSAGLLAIASSKSWRYLHFTVKSTYYGLMESKSGDLKKLTAEQLLSDTVQQFRLYRHRIAERETTQYRIGVKKTRSVAAKFQPEWINVDEENEY